jgi:hypothetical protein
MSSTNAAQPIGPVLDALGVTCDLGENQQVTEVLVIAKIHDFERGGVALGVYHSDVDWISQLGLLDAGRMVIQDAPFSDANDPDQ